LIDANAFAGSPDRRIAGCRRAGAHHDGGIDAGFEKGNSGPDKRLAGDGLGGVSPERMAGHADVFRIEAALQRMLLFTVPADECVDHHRDVLISC